ncbi:MAG: hypothetical protein V1853_04740 [bacterium]
MCGIAGVINHPVAAHKALHAVTELRHRGQGRRGVATSSSGNQPYVRIEKHGRPLLDSVESQRQLFGSAALAFGRYPTSGSNDNEVDTQPAFADGIVGGREVRLVLVENGDTPCLEEFREKYEDLRSTTEAEPLARYLIDRLESGKPIIQALQELVVEYDGAFAMIVLYDGKMYLVRDRQAMRPLWFGTGTRQSNRKFQAAASEDVALRSIGVIPEREVGPGEIIVIGPMGLEVCIPYQGPKTRLAKCLFEPVYFAGVVSEILGVKAEFFRFILGKIIGERLKQNGKEVDAVGSVPDSSNPFAEGVAEGLGVRLTHALIRKHRAGRTFIDETGDRPRSVREKFQVSLRIKGLRLMLVDDSIIRGSTMLELGKLIRASGNLAEFHVVAGSPPVVANCYYGINQKTPNKLIARQFLNPEGVVDIEALAKHLNLTSLTYATLEEMFQVLQELGADPEEFCAACWNLKYPTPGGQAIADRTLKM